jgi:hypothetical protein
MSGIHQVEDIIEDVVHLVEEFVQDVLDCGGGSTYAQPITLNVTVV